MAGTNELWAVAPGKASPEGLTSSAPVTEYAWPFTSFWNVTASESAALVICKRPENQPGCRAGQPAPSPPPRGPASWDRGTRLQRPGPGEEGVGRGGHLALRMAQSRASPLRTSVDNQSKG